MPDWTLDDIARQASRGGVNRQQVEELLRTIHQLETFLDQATTDAARWKSMWFDDNFAWQKQVDDLYDAIIRHRNVWANTTSAGDPRRDDANDVLWALVENDGRAEEEWHTDA